MRLNKKGKIQQLASIDSAVLTERSNRVTGNGNTLQVVVGGRVNRIVTHKQRYCEAENELASQLNGF